MKKTYFSPEIEIVKLNNNLNLLAGSEKEDITDGPVDIIDPDPDDDEDGGWK